MLSLILTIIIVGVLLWLVNTYIPMAPPLKQILTVVVVIGVVILRALGVRSLRLSEYPAPPRSLIP